MYVQQTPPDRDRLGWFVHTPLTAAGHEVLTTDAARGLPISPAQLACLIEGVRRPDTASLTAHVVPGEQRRHTLRSTILQSQRAALADAVGHLRALHARALAPGLPSQERFRLIGEALHLIQDAYAPAHVARDPGGRIRRIRNYGPANLTLPVLLQPGEHRFPVDLRDRIRTGGPGSALTPEARAAVAASREYLVMALRHLGGSTPPAQVRTDLDAFIRRHFRL